MEPIFGNTFIKANDFIKVTGISRATFYRLRKHPDFPKPVNIAANSPRYWGPACDVFLKSRQAA